MVRLTLFRRSVVEALGTLFLVAGVVGSGIMAERLAAGNVALALLCNTIATGAVLIALILTLGPLSGAHLNPVVTMAEVLSGTRSAREGGAYVTAQMLGGIGGVGLAHAMFGLPLFARSGHVRAGHAQWLSELVATFGLLLVIRVGSRHRPEAVPLAVAAFITAAYWFTASTSFANPAVTLARSLTDTFAGIRPLDVPGFVLAQLSGAAAAALLSAWLERDPHEEKAA